MRKRPEPEIDRQLQKIKTLLEYQTALPEWLTLLPELAPELQRGDGKRALSKNLNYFWVSHLTFNFNIP